MGRLIFVNKIVTQHFETNTWSSLPYSYLFYEVIKFQRRMSYNVFLLRIYVFYKKRFFSKLTNVDDLDVFDILEEVEGERDVLQLLRTEGHLLVVLAEILLREDCSQSDQLQAIRKVRVLQQCILIEKNGVNFGTIKRIFNRMFRANFSKTRLAVLSMAYNLRRNR